VRVWRSTPSPDGCGSCRSALVRDDAFTTFANDITTDRWRSAALSKSFNIAGVGVGVGVAASADGNAFFTVVLALRTVVGTRRGV
jgi:hypothetical protein